MLQHLTISHYALIENLDIDFMSGFSVITGETGAGKSIILGAINLLLGGRADSKSIQSGEKKCMVEATFGIKYIQLLDFFSQNDIDFDEEECIIRREVMNTGKSRAFINDTPVPATKLRELGEHLIDIHSQHQNLLIRNEHFLLDTLDTAAALPSLLETYRTAYLQHRDAENRLQALIEETQKGKADKEYWQFQLSQLEEVAPLSGEQDELEHEQDILSHAEEIKHTLFNAGSLIVSDTCSITQNIRQASNALFSLSDKLPEAAALAERLNSAYIELEDIHSEIEHKVETIDYDANRLSYIEERLNRLYELEQKHHVENSDDLLLIIKDLQTKLSAIESSDEDIERLQAEVNKLHKEVVKTADVLTRSRKKAAKQIEEALTSSLHNLGMPHIQICLQITPRKQFDLTGADNATFLFSANKNVPMQDVSQIASGGEIARLMLALKALMARQTNLPTIVFDEIDTGVSGTMAERMAKVMQEISQNSQVVCITHLPQIAAHGSHHYRVYKEDSNDITRSHIVPLNKEERIEEIAKMLSGSELTEAAKQNAQALLSSVNE